MLSCMNTTLFPLQANCVDIWPCLVMTYLRFSQENWRLFASWRGGFWCGHNLPFPCHFKLATLMWALIDGAGDYGSPGVFCWFGHSAVILLLLTHLHDHCIFTACSHLFPLSCSLLGIFHPNQMLASQLQPKSVWWSSRLSSTRHDSISWPSCLNDVNNSLC